MDDFTLHVIVEDFEQDKKLIKQFLKDFTYIDDDGVVKSKYAAELTQLANQEKVHMYINMGDLEKFNSDLARQAVRNAKRYNLLFYEVLDEILPSYKTREPERKDVMDIFIEQRLFIADRNQRSNATGSGPGVTQTTNPNPSTGLDVDGLYPPDLVRKEELYFKPAKFIATPISELKADEIGSLVTIRGIVTRVTDVKPKITIATYTCDQCGCESFQPVRSATFMPLRECSSSACRANKTLGRMNLQIRGSKFVKYQKIKVQEHRDQVPEGHMPRTITVEANGEITRSCAPGDHVSISGVFLPIARRKYRIRVQKHSGQVLEGHIPRTITVEANGKITLPFAPSDHVSISGVLLPNRIKDAGYSTKNCIEAHYITQISKNEDDEINDVPLTAQETKDLLEGEENFLDKLSRSIAPGIWGLEKLKKALLLLLVGGVDTNAHGMKVRGNINICLMGDPGVGKSQLLASIDKLASRGSLKTCRGSSGIGLTGAVLKDPITNELVLEGGALVLADGGVCCIDEFDKIVDDDKTAIHEVMEQQTVSIAKAGIMTTLNARVSILAAANPSFGRFNINRSIEDNLQLPPALLSRFDLLWLIRDEPNFSLDVDIAKHVANIHQDTPSNEVLDLDVMRRYINLCKLIKPDVPKDLTERFVDIYLNIRERKRKNPNEDSLFTSARSLLAIIRLSTAFARLRLSKTVEMTDVDAAVAIFDHSRNSVMSGTATEELFGSRVFKMLRAFSVKKDSTHLDYNDFVAWASARGLNETDIEPGLNLLKEMESIEFVGKNIFLV